MTDKPTVVCLVGPTACHKTEVSIALAKSLNGEIVSADSVAVYRRLDIGSAKPTKPERGNVPHHMIDVADITDSDFTVARFRLEARMAIDGILSRYRLPIVVGGSGLYSDAIFSEMHFSAPSDAVVRGRVEQSYRADPVSVFERLRALDPVTAARLHINDAKRVIRALEIFEITGKPFSEWNESFQKAQETGGIYRVLRYGLDMDRQTLYERIDMRVDRMFDDGLVKEAYALFDMGFTPDRYTAMQAIGYAQLFDAWKGFCTVDAAKAKIKLDTRHFAKRQLTWFRRNQSTRWYRVDAYSSVSDLEQEMIKDIQKEL